MAFGRFFSLFHWISNTTKSDVTSCRTYKTLPEFLQRFAAACGNPSLSAIDGHGL